MAYNDIKIKMYCISSFGGDTENMTFDCLPPAANPQAQRLLGLAQVTCTDALNASSQVFTSAPMTPPEGEEGMRHSSPVTAASRQMSLAEDELGKKCAQ